MCGYMVYYLQLLGVKLPVQDSSLFWFFFREWIYVYENVTSGPSQYPYHSFMYMYTVVFINFIE